MKILASFLILMIIFSGLVWTGCGGGDETEEATSEPDMTPGITSTKPTIVPPSTTQTAQPTLTPAQTPTPTPTMDDGDKQSPTPSPEDTTTPAPTQAPTPTATPTPSPTPTQTMSPTPTPTQTQDPATGISFPDTNLESAIRAAISKPSGSITQSDLVGLTTLVATDSGIADLTGLEYCTSLNVLDLSHNNITDISPLMGNNGITSGDKIDVGWNPLNNTSIQYVKQLVDNGVNVVWGSL